MYRLKGFVQVSTSLNKTPSTLSPWGEMSTQAFTYSKTKLLYVDTAPTNTSLTVFSSKDSVGFLTPPTIIKNKIFEVIGWILTNQSDKAKAFTTREDLLSAITTNYTTVLTGINIGKLVSDSSGVSMPEWIGFTVINTGTTTIENEIKVWLSDSSFLNEYDELEITVVPPLKTLSDLFLPSATLSTKLQDYQDNYLVDSIQTAKGTTPESSITSIIFNRNDPANPSIQTPTRWTVLLYGRVGNDIDAVKNAIKTYITTKSTKQLSEWKTIFPDIFKNTMFYVFPRWKNYSIQERTLLTGQHSPIVDPNKEIIYVKDLLPELTESFVKVNLRTMPTQYKSLALMLIGGLDNRNNLFSINQVFKDVMNVPTTDPLYDLMSVETKDWLALMVKCLKVAEETGVYDTVPAGMSKVILNNIVFITFVYKNISYLVSTKESTPNYV